MFLTNHSSPFSLHDVRVVKNVACLSSLLSVQREPEVQLMNTQDQLSSMFNDSLIRVFEVATLLSSQVLLMWR